MVELFLQTPIPQGLDPYDAAIVTIVFILISAAGGMIGAMWRQMNIRTNEFLAHLKATAELHTETAKVQAAALQSVAENLRALERAMADHERRAEDRHVRVMKNTDRARD